MCLALHCAKNYTLQANFENGQAAPPEYPWFPVVELDIFPNWLAKYSFRECKARHVISKPLKNQTESF